MNSKISVGLFKYAHDYDDGQANDIGILEYLIPFRRLFKYSRLV